MPKIDPRDSIVRAIEAIASGMNVGDHTPSQGMQAELNRLRRGVEALDTMNRSRSPLDTPDAHALKVAKAARKYEADIKATMQRIGGIATAGFEDVNRRRAEKVNLTPDAFAGEIRSVFRSLDAVGRAKMLEEFVSGNRGPELAALVNAPGSVTGIPDNERQSCLASIYAKHAAEETADEAMVNDSLDSSLAAINAAQQLVKELTDPRKIAEIERGAADADAAGEAFNQSMQ
ncbi:MAG: hypothetical protein R3E21_08170 [Caenibius sp.]